MNPSRHTFLGIYLVLAALLLLVTWPRFDRQDLFIDAWTHPQNVDTESYAAMAREFRNPPDWQLFIRPFCFRPLTPLLASLLPLPPGTAVNVINLGWLLAALFFLLKILDHQNFSPPWQAVGGALLVIAFPTFYYSTIGLVDPGILFICALGGYYLKQDRLWATVVLALLGMLIMEKAVLLIPPLFGALLSRGRHWLVAGFLAFAGLVGCMMVLWLLQHFGPVEKGDAYFWKPRPEVVLANLSRFEFWAGSLLCFGAPGFLLLYWPARTLPGNGLRLETWRPWLIDLCGTLGGFGLWGWALISAHGDGRSLWLVYPFMIPLALRGLQYLFGAPEKLARTAPLLSKENLAPQQEPMHDLDRS